MNIQEIEQDFIEPLKKMVIKLDDMSENSDISDKIVDACNSLDNAIENLKEAVRLAEAKEAE